MGTCRCFSSARNFPAYTKCTCDGRAETTIRSSFLPHMGGKDKKMNQTEKKNLTFNDEFIGQLMDCVNDFLVSQKIHLPRSEEDKAREREIEGNNENFEEEKADYAAICGRDYDDLAAMFMATMRSWTCGNTICPYVDEKGKMLPPEICVSPEEERGYPAESGKRGVLRVDTPRGPITAKATGSFDAYPGIVVSIPDQPGPDAACDEYGVLVEYPYAEDAEGKPKGSGRRFVYRIWAEKSQEDPSIGGTFPTKDDE